MPSDTELLHTFELVAVKSAGVDCDSSWSVCDVWIVHNTQIMFKRQKKTNSKTKTKQNKQDKPNKHFAC